MSVIAPTNPVGLLPAPFEEEFDSGVYVTDGLRLFRVVSPGGSLFPSAELEDCHTLEIERYFSDELYAMRLQRVPVAHCLA